MGLLDGFKGMLADYTPNLLPEDPDKNAAMRQALLTAGAAMMATKGQNFLGTTGQGMLAGGEAYQGALAQQQQDRLRKAQQERWDLENQQNTAALNREKEADGIIASFGDPGSISGATGMPPASNGAPAWSGGPPPDLPRIGQSRRPPAFDSSLDGAPGAGGSMPTAFSPGQPPRTLPSLEGVPMLDGSQPAPRRATPLEGVPKIGDSEESRSAYASKSYEKNMDLAQRLMAKGHIKRAKEYFEAAKAAEPKVKDIRELTTHDGRSVVVNMFEDGRPPQEIEGYVPQGSKLTYQDLGNITVGLDSQGVEKVRFKNGERPGSGPRARTGGRGGAGGTGTSADPSMDDDTLDFLAERALRGDRTALQNMGRGAQGAANLVAVNQRIARKAKEQGLTGGDLASINADYQGQVAGLRTSGTISARIENAAAEAAELAPLALAASEKVARSGLLPFGRAEMMFNKNTNSPEMNEFATANIGLATAYAGAMARGGKSTVADMEHARELLATAKSHEAYKAIVGQIKLEIQAAQRAPQRVRTHLRTEISGRGGDHGAPEGGKPANKVTPLNEVPKKPPAVGTVDAGHRFKGGNPADPKNWEKVR
jgi:hypothetical protein